MSKSTPANEPLSTTRATPKLAPEEMPKTEGPASGLLKSVCKNKPERPRAAPTERAVIACGKRYCITIILFEPSASLPLNTLSTLSHGIKTEPYQRFSRNSIITPASNNTKRTDVFVVLSKEFVFGQRYDFDVYD